MTNDERPSQSSIRTSQQIGPWEVLFSWPEGVDQGGPWWLEVRPRADAMPDELAAGLSSTVLRQVDFKAAAQARRDSTNLIDEKTGQDLSKVLEHLTLLLRDSVKEGVTVRYLSLLAHAYVILVTLGESSVTANLAGLVGKQPETIRAHLKAARSQGLLTTVKGKAGGQLTEEAQRILNHASIAGNKSYRLNP